MAAAYIDDELWNDFHRLVNMSASSLDAWLRIVSVDPDWELSPDRAGMWTGHRVLALLGKDRAELTGGDVALMRMVVEQVRAELRGDNDPNSSHAARHRRLLSIGHDPLKAA